MAFDSGSRPPGGSAAEGVGRRLKKLASANQVLGTAVHQKHGTIDWQVVPRLAAGSLPAYLQGWGQPSGVPLARMLAALLAYQPFGLALGIAGGIGGLRRKDPLDTALFTLWAAALLIPIGITIVLNAIRMPATALRANVALRRAFYEQAGIKGPVGLRSLADPIILANGLRRSPDYSLISTLRRLDQMAPDVKRHTAVFIPQSDTAFWRTAC